VCVCVCERASVSVGVSIPDINFNILLIHIITLSHHKPYYYIPDIYLIITKSKRAIIDFI
jgi:hypothetical protein